MMMPLSHANRIQLDAAEGWLSLGNPREAEAELEKISEQNADHPAVLVMSWQAAASAGRWQKAHRAIKALCEMAPMSAQAWVLQAETLRHLRGPKAAWTLLLRVVSRFPADAVLSYRLACYAAQTGLFGESCTWLLRAFELETSGQLRLTAILDTELDPLWEQIAQLENFRLAKPSRRRARRPRLAASPIAAETTPQPEA
jgi:uncharacterized protein HemY